MDLYAINLIDQPSFRIKFTTLVLQAVNHFWHLWAKLLRASYTSSYRRLDTYIASDPLYVSSINLLELWPLQLALNLHNVVIFSKILPDYIFWACCYRNIKNSIDNFLHRQCCFVFFFCRACVTIRHLPRSRVKLWPGWSGDAAINLQPFETNEIGYIEAYLPSWYYLDIKINEL